VARPLVLIGTGTSVGKTYVGERLLRALAQRGRPALGYKPVESGVTAESRDTDAQRLEGASTCHVTPAPYRLDLRLPVSPHLAARAEGRTIDVDLIRTEIRRLTDAVPVLLVELPGGAFSPFSETHRAADFARALPSVRALLVAPDRLGVLHDLGATCLACAALGLPLEGIVLSAPPVPDDSTGRNRPEVPLVTDVPVLASFGRTSPDSALAPNDPAFELLERLRL
jgi:dethiobiotin synthetase